MKIKVNRIPPQIVHIYQDGKFVGTCRNEMEFNDVRIQVAENRLENVELEFDRSRFPILNNGTLNGWPKELYPTIPNQLRQLMKLQNQIRKDEINK